MKKLTIPTMMCQNCVKAVKEALEKVPGVTAVEVSLENKTAVVSGEASDAQLKTAVEDIGFDVTEII